MHHSYLDKFASMDSPVHRLDPRVKTLAVAVFIGFVVSVGRREVLGLVPFALFPGILVAVSGVPAGYLLRRIAITSPLLLSLAILPPIFSRQPALYFGSLAVTVGMLNAANLVIKFCLCVTATLVLTSTTPFDRLLRGLQWLGLPKMLLVQLSFLYRYLFVMADEGIHMKVARDSRLFARAAPGRRLRAVGGALGVLFMRTLDRSERIYAAMASRGFDGTVRTISDLKFRAADFVFIGATAAYCCFLWFGLM